MMQQEPRISLIVGLGNPGREYAGTRHNAGFDVVARLLRRFPGEFAESHRHESRCFEGRFRGRSLMLQLPQTYMNLSGTAVAGLLRKRGLAPEEMLVISDDLDLPLGRMRIRVGGSAGGHRGLESIIAETGSAGFVRLRIGIGRDRNEAVTDYVLGRMDEAEQPIYEKVLDGATDAALAILTGGVSRAMNQYNAWRPATQETDSGDAAEVKKTETLS